MFSYGKIERLWLAEHRVDFRKQEHGLLAEVYSLGLDPFSGDVILFIGKGKRKIKILYADSSGLWLSKKVFTKEAMKTKFCFLENKNIRHISMSDLVLLIEGASYTVHKKVSHWPK